MCGLIGVLQYASNGFDYTAKNALYPMLLLNSLRGIHSTGMAGIEYAHAAKVGPRPDIVKRIGHPYLLLNEPKGKEFMDRVYSRYQAVLGHGRYATQGKITAPNAHPFQAGDITLIHNGSIRNFHELSHNGDKLRDLFEVDSEAFTYLVSEVGIHEAAKQVEGAFALLWYDASQQAIFALRNKERPLWIAKRTNPDNIYFSSEPQTLSYLAERFPDIKYKDGVKYLEEDYIYRFDMGWNNRLSIQREKCVIGATKVRSYGYNFVTNRGRGGANFDHYGDMSGMGWEGDLDNTEEERSQSQMRDLFNENRSSISNPQETELTRIRREAEEEVIRRNRERLSTQPGMAHVIPFDKKKTAGPIEQKHLEDTKKNKDLARIKAIKVPDTDYSLNQGDLIAFYAENFEEAKDHGYISGSCAEMPNVSVGLHIPGDISEYKNDTILVGEIANILYIPDTKNKIRVYLKNPQRVHPRVMAMIFHDEKFNLDAMMKKYPHTGEDDDSVTVILKDGSEVKLSHYESLIRDGCVSCNGEINIEEATQCLPVAALHNATEKEKKHGGLVCPDCVTRRVVN